MVSAAELLGTFNGNNVADIFNDADDPLFPHTVGAYRADISIRYIETSLAEFYLRSHPGDHFAELLNFGGILFQKMEHEP